MRKAKIITDMTAWFTHPYWSILHVLANWATCSKVSHPVSATLVEACVSHGTNTKLSLGKLGLHQTNFTAVDASKMRARLTCISTHCREIRRPPVAFDAIILSRSTVSLENPSVDVCTVRPCQTRRCSVPHCLVLHFPPFPECFLFNPRNKLPVASPGVN